ncbi:5-(carboxyamino)imidazole ribonucleotide synthase [Dongia sedimenti]|uniref:N5-carboxyaminoimidazole ribonucleotide synthase n=1 Tax=Dongia sedimenti TaxID=3064282 RepID=A0ABU0YH86_9PROT|nr:5-(carboxyamino)imidazole ribonucleotide synthase [Rhodospirillaceae bacterium R-7]
MNATPKSADQNQVIAPGGVIGILGGGQLGRMTAMAAARLGYRVHTFCPDRNAPASHVSWHNTVAAYDNKSALKAFAESVDVVTFEFENIPSATTDYLAALKPTRPKPNVLYLTQERLREKRFLASINVPTTKFLDVGRQEALESAVKALGRPAILKSAEFGYDGKGQVRIDGDMDLFEAWVKMGGEVGILEAYVDFVREISVIVARGPDGSTAIYQPVENQHKNHILDVTMVPARVSQAVAGRAEAIARHIATELELVGLLAVEMFVTHNDEVLVNELAPRPHNSGHWTIDGSVTSQFEQFVRAVCGLPLGSTERHSDAVMKNLIGDDVNGWRELLNDPAVKLHLYGKEEARPGRKMGHYTRLSPKAGIRTGDDRR